MNNERVTPKNAAKELQMDVITLRELMKREKLPIGYTEKLSEENRTRLYEKCKKKGLQFIATRTTSNNELTVIEL